MNERPASYLLKSVTLVDPGSEHNLMKRDILIEQGRIAQIDEEIRDDNAQIFSPGHVYVGIGWCDIGSYCGEPGMEVHETFETLTSAARAGGFTQVALFSNEERPFDNRHIVRDTQSASQHGVEIIPVPAVSKGLKGIELAELLELAEVAVPLFTDGFHCVYDNSLLHKAMEYSRQCDGRLLTIPGAVTGLKGGQVNESKVSAQMGIPGIPGFEEVALLSGHLSLASYADARICVHLVSHRDTIDQIKFRQEQGMDVSASVSSMHLRHTEEDVVNFDENFKILPPLRTDEDRSALIKALKDGVIQYVCSNHFPVSSEQKDREFGESPFGATGLETSFLNLVTAIEDITPEQVQEWLAVNPRKALGLTQRSIEVGQPADLTLFDLNGTTQWGASQSVSLSKNSPYKNSTFKGKIIGTIKGDYVQLNA